MHCLWAEATGLIEVGTMAGTGKTAHAAGPHAGAQTASAVDDGAFRESLKASVGVPVGGRTVMVVPVPVALPAVEKPVLAASAGAVVKAVPGPLVRDAAGAGQAKSSGEAPAAVARGEDEDVGPLVQAPATVRTVAAVAVEDGAIKTPVEAGAGAKAGAEVKAAKSESGSKKPVASPGAAGATGAPAQAAAAAETVVSTPVAVVAAQVPPVAVLEVTVTATAAAETGQAKVSTDAVGGSGRAAKGVGANVAAKGSGREVKKVEGEMAVSPKAGTGAAGAVTTPVAGGGAGHSVGKEGTAAVAAQGMGGAAAVVPVAQVGAVASHTGVGGGSGVKVAASVEAVSTPAGQGAAAGPEVKTLAATPNLLEVGIDGGTHGWLRVRAELGQTGEVTASVVAGSAGQADTLRRELPAMSTYLAGESVGVSSLVVNAAGTAAGAQDAAMNLGAGAQGGGDGRAQQGSVGAQGGEAGGGAGGSSEGATGLEFSGAELPAAVYANGSGSWLSVRV